MFPNCITEMLDEERSTPENKIYKKAINFELLKQMLSSHVLDGDEAYAREHFKAISNGNVVYDVVDSYQSLLNMVMK